MTRSPLPGAPATYNSLGALICPAHIPCLPPEIIADVRPGERIWLDDGKIGGIIRSVTAEEIEVEIIQARVKGDKLRAEKGINLPDSRLNLSALTAKDLEDLPFIIQHADLVGLSFIQSAEDVNRLVARLAQSDGKRPGIVLKIETRRAFEELP